MKILIHKIKQLSSMTKCNVRHTQKTANYQYRAKSCNILTNKFNFRFNRIYFIIHVIFLINTQFHQVHHLIHAMYKKINAELYVYITYR